MQVFKTYMKILIKNLPGTLLYIGIFAVMLIIMSTTNNSSTGYSDVTLSVGIIDEDQSDASAALQAYIEKTNDVVSVEQNKEWILDALFYEKIDYVLIIQNGYEDKLSQGITKELFQNYQLPGSYSSTLFEQTLDEYVKTACAYLTGGTDLNAALENADEALALEIPVTKETFTEENTTNFSDAYAYFYQFLAYILIGIFMNSVCPVLLILNRKELKNRVNSSCISQMSVTFQTMLGSAVVFFGVWILLVIISTIVGGGALDKMSMLAILNSFVYMLVAAGIALLSSALISDKNIVNVVTNVVGLGMSFLCGVFVPQSLLGDGVLMAARFLPAYWYVRVNNMLAGISGEIYDGSSYLLFLGIQFGFAVLLFLSYILVTRFKYQENHS